LITTKRAVKPEAHPNLSIREINNTKNLLLEMKERVADYQVLIHSMAVSDYTPVYMTGVEEVQSSSNLEEFLRVPDGTEGFAMAFDKGKHTELIKKIDAAIDELQKSGEFDKMLDKYGLKK